MRFPQRFIRVLRRVLGHDPGIELLPYIYYIVRHCSLQRSYSSGLFRINAKFKGVKVGKRPGVWGKLHIVKYPGSTIEIGDSFVCVSDNVRATASTVGTARIKTFSPSARVLIGNHVGMNGTSLTCRSTYIKIGNNAKIGPDCVIVDSDFHVVEPDRRSVYCEGEDKGVEIERNVWIGMRCIILKGVTIGENSVIGAGSVVTKDVEPNSVYAGNPARLIRKL